MGKPFKPQNVRMPFGKHRGMPLRKIAQVEPRYLVWASENLEHIDGNLKEAIDYMAAKVLRSREGRSHERARELVDVPPRSARSPERPAVESKSFGIDFTSNPVDPASRFFKIPLDD